MIEVQISWDKLKDVPRGLYPTPPQPEILEWLEENCKSFEYPIRIEPTRERRIMPCWEYARFKSKEDAMKFKLVWG